MEEPRMSTTLMIPARVIPRIREGAYAVARDVAERIDQAAAVEELRAARDQLCGVCGLLASVESASLEETTDIELDGSEYAAALAAVVSLMLPLMKRWLDELPSDDTARPTCGVEHRLMCELQASVRSVLGRPGLIVVPADVLGELREGLFSLLCDVVQGLDAVLVRPAHKRDRGWVGPVARFDHVRAVLDSIGWEQRDPEPDVEVDLSWHGQAVREALARELDSMLYLSEEVDGGQQREWATGNAELIERFIAELGDEP
jgi:hypothetical protein